MYEIYRHMPYGTGYDDTTMMLRDGSLCVAFEVRGVNADTTDEIDVLSLRSQISHLLTGMDEKFAFYIHKYRRGVRISGFSKPKQAFAKALDDAWFKALEGNEPKETVVVLTIIRVNTSPVRIPLFSRFLKKIGEKSVPERVAELAETASAFTDSLGVSLKPLTIEDGQFGAAMSVINFQPYYPSARGMLTLVAQDVSNVDLEFRKDGIVEIDGGQAFGVVLSVKEYPVKTIPGTLDALHALDDVVVVQSFTPIHRDEIAEQARLRLAQMEASEDMANRISAQLMDTADRIEAGELGVGEHHLSVLVRADDLEELDQRVSDAMSICQRAGFRMIRDRSTHATEMFASHPGNMFMRSRSMLQTSETFSDLASFHGNDIGPDVGNVPWNEPVTVLQTEQGTPYRFSFHAPGSPDDEPTNCHTLVLGPSYGGKTTTTLFLAAQALRAGGRIVALDKNRAMEMPIRALGGTYAAVKVGEPTGLNPLLTETGARGEAWLMQWFSALLETTGDPLTPMQAKVLRTAIRQNADGPEYLRTFNNFMALVGDADDDGDLSLRVREWGPDGRYSWVFGENDDVLVNFQKSDVTAVDLTEVLKLGTERTAILGYLFRALEVVMEEKRPMVLLIDEAWQVLDDEYFAKMLDEWLVTVRKLHVVVVAMTQFPSQVERSASKSVLQGLPNQLIFPNKRAVPKDYASLNLTDGEMAFAIGQPSGRRRALYRTDTGSTILDVDLSGLGDLLTALGGGKAGIERFGEDYAQDSDFWRSGSTEIIDFQKPEKKVAHG